MSRKRYTMLYEDLDLSYDAGQLFDEEDIFGVHWDEGMHA